jgi:hypothetical protein
MSIVSDAGICVEGPGLAEFRQMRLVCAYSERMTGPVKVRVPIADDFLKLVERLKLARPDIKRKIERRRGAKATC